MATYKVDANGKAPSGLKAGDSVVTGGGTYTITGTKADGTYTSEKTNSNQTTHNYTGSYASSPSSNTSSGGSSSGSSGGNKNNSSGSSVGSTSSGFETLQNVNNGGSNTQYANVASAGKIVQAGADGKAQKGLSAGDVVVTNGGMYKINSVNSDGTYNTSKINNTTASQYSSNGGFYTGMATNLSDKDKSLSSEAQQAIKQAKENYAYYQAIGDKAGMAAANEQANAIRQQYGYTGGTDGSQYIQTSRTAKDKTGQDIRVGLDENGNITGIFDSKGQLIDYGGSISMVGADGKSGQYIVNKNVSTGALNLIRVTNSTVDIVERREDGSMSSTTLMDANGNAISGNDLVLGDDNRNYDKRTGEWIGDIAMQYGIDPSNYAIKNGDKYFSIDGQDITDQLGPASITQWTQNKIYNELLSAMMKAGYNQTPQYDDYEKLSWEQALSQAGAELGSGYQQALNNTLSDIEQKALETGFYGQLPTEALRQQAASSNELAKQQAMYELARELMSDSRDFAQKRFDNDNKTSATRMNTIQSIFETLYQMEQDEIRNARTQQELDNTINNTIIKAINAYTNAQKKGMTDSEILSNLSSLIYE